MNFTLVFMFKMMTVIEIILMTAIVKPAKTVRRCRR